MTGGGFGGLPPWPPAGYGHAPRLSIAKFTVALSVYA